MKVYLDNAATTKVDDEVFKAMKEYFLDKYGNASSLHSFGKEAREALEKSRERISKIINCKTSEITFTSGGTESDNLAIKGLAFMQDKKKKNHIITSVIEHPAVLKTCRELEREGFSVTYLPVNSEGFISLERLKKEINKKTFLISIMHVNNEIGTIQNIKEIGKICKKNNVIFHTDAVQSFGKLKIDVKKMNIDMLSVSGHKIHGPKGIGFLYKNEEIRLKPLMQGGGHEKGLRPGTENIPGIVGMAKAAELAYKNLDKTNEKICKLRNKLINEILKIKSSRLNGPYDKKWDKRVSINANFSFKGIEGEALIMLLDIKGIAASTGSACSNILRSKGHKTSHVIEAIKVPKEYANGSLRLTLSRFTTEEEINYTIKAVKEAVLNLQKISAIK